MIFSFCTSVMPERIQDILRHYPEITGVHPAADLFPLLQEEEFQALCADIQERGLVQPVTIWTDGTLLDGRNRLLACFEVNQEVVVEVYAGDDPVEHSLSVNLHRRHLTTGQRAALALKVRELLQPEAKERQREAGEQFGRGAKVSADLREANHPPAEQRKTTAQAAKAVGTSTRAVEQAARVAKAAPDLLPALATGEVSLNRAHQQAITREQKATVPETATWPAELLAKKDRIERGGTVVVNLHKGSPDAPLVKWAEARGLLTRIDRKSPWGNPFVLNEDGNRDTVCDSYAIYFARKYGLQERMAELRGKALGCWCAPERCHGDHLLELLEEG